MNRESGSCETCWLAAICLSLLMWLLSLFAQSLLYMLSLPQLINMTAVLFGCTVLTYIDFSHQDVSDAAQHGHKVKHVPGIL